jgi:heterodisulfide reductase subunit A
MMSDANGDRAVLVVGAGVAGMQSALDLANAGVKVYLVDESPTIGGKITELERTYLDDTPTYCRVAPLLDAVLEHPNIQVISNASVGRIKGSPGEFKIQVTQGPLRVTEQCDNCGRCVEVCPVKPYDTFNEGLMLRTAIDIRDPHSVAARCHIEKETPICQETCPVHINIRRYVGLVADGRYEEALAEVRDRNPLPAVCGRVCHHPCESACNRGHQDEPVAIDAIKRFAADYELALRKAGKSFLPPVPKKMPDSKVAVVGAGPAGLTVAHDLALLGYEPTIFEAAPVPGGMLWICIPEYRLPRDIIQAEVDYIKHLGVELKLNTPIGPDLTFDDLLNQGFKAVFLGIGAHKGLKLRVEGEDDFEGFLDCIQFLRQVNLGDTSKPGKKVVVIGGGNSAIDSARTALRVGSDEVTILYRRTRREMPANSWEIDEAEHEGVRLEYLAAPVKILGENGKVCGMLCQKMELGKLDASGRRRPVPIEGSEFEIETDCVIPAISQEPDISFLHEDHGLEISRWNSIVIDSRTGMTNRPGIFSGGDADTGPATVIEAIAAGHVAAEGMHRYIQDQR